MNTSICAFFLILTMSSCSPAVVALKCWVGVQHTAEKLPPMEYIKSECQSSLSEFGPVNCITHYLNDYNKYGVVLDANFTGSTCGNCRHVMLVTLLKAAVFWEKLGIEDDIVEGWTKKLQQSWKCVECTDNLCNHHSSADSTDADDVSNNEHYHDEM